MTMRIDDPVLPPDPARDALRRARPRRVRGLDALGVLVFLGQPAAAMVGGAMVGGLLHGRPIVGAVGMVLAWLAARGLLMVLGLFALASAAPALSRRADEPFQVPRRTGRLLGIAMVGHVATFAMLGAITGLACGWLSGVAFAWAAALALGACGGLLALLTPFAAPEGV